MMICSKDSLEGDNHGTVCDNFVLCCSVGEYSVQFTHELTPHPSVLTQRNFTGSAHAGNSQDARFKGEPTLKMSFLLRFKQSLLSTAVTLSRSCSDST